MTEIKNYLRRVTPPVVIDIYHSILSKLCTKKSLQTAPLISYYDKGNLKLSDSLSGILHQSTSVFIEESAAIMQYYKGGIYLDIGCGRRKVADKAIGVDLEDVKDSLRSLINIVTSSDNLYCFASGTIDFISSIHSFEHYPNPDEVLDEWFRVLKPGGRVGIVVPDKNGPIPSNDIIRDHCFDYDKEQLKSLAKRHSHQFEILAIDTLKNGWSIDLVLEKNKELAGVE